MSGSYAQNFSPARALSPHLRTPPDVDSQYLTELLAEHQKLGPFAQVVPICGRLLNQEIIRVSGMMPNQGFSDFDRMQRGSPSPIGSDIMPNYRGSGLGGWNGRPHDVERQYCLLFVDLKTAKTLLCISLRHGFFLGHSQSVIKAGVSVNPLASYTLKSIIIW